LDSFLGAQAIQAPPLLDLGGGGIERLCTAATAFRLPVAPVDGEDGSRSPARRGEGIEERSRRRGLDLARTAGEGLQRREEDQEIGPIRLQGLCQDLRSRGRRGQ